jgi:hypothetical protein
MMAMSSTTIDHHHDHLGQDDNTSNSFCKGMPMVM